MDQFYLSRPTVRRFVDAVEWVSSRNIIILARGRYLGDHSNIYRVELDRLAKTKRVEPLRKIRSQAGHIVYTIPRSKKNTIGTFKFFHDNCLRDCLAKFIHDRDYRDIEKLSIANDKNADAYFPGLYFEFDNGHMTDRQLEEKLRATYSDQGAYRVLFIMGSRYSAEAERARLKKIIDIAKRVLYKKPGRILATTYHGYMDTGKVFNAKGEVILNENT